MKKQWVLETRRMVKSTAPDFRTVADEDGKAWYIWKRHITWGKDPRSGSPMANLDPFTLEECVRQWHLTDSKSLELDQKNILAPIDPTVHRIHNIVTGEVIPCAAL